ncbi:arabinogalactan endo-1,4-beta-galactosidase [Desulfonema ishimotonii]|uniref:Arabinogalactan endo-1,4-beta-galactosidase n=1 Tax=Desulfonema ishimotonii TaxID=45657 RepID=A0A401G3D0_9BACT|nr:arabinogalactan endo-1,4-beta-galactosidase [Desulfonema ishimotonii]
MEWDPNTESDLAGYKVYYGTASEDYQHHVDVGSYTGCTISGLEEDTTYYFAATAYGSGGYESGFSSEISQYIPISATDYSVIPWSQLSIVSSDSEELTGENGSAGNAIDGDPLTLWHTEWSQSTPEHPHEIVIDLGDVYVVGGFQYLPRQDGGTNGTVADYAFYVSTDGVAWNAPVAEGTFAADTAKKETGFSGKAGRYVRFVALSDINGGPWTTVAEINILGKVPADSDEDGITDDDEINVYGTDPEKADTDGDGINDGDELIFWGDNWDGDYDSDGIVNILDQDADGDGVSDGEETLVGTNPAYDDTPDQNYSVIPWSQLSIVSSDSEELTGENGSAGNAIDGDPLTLWHTEWSQSTPEHPHEIVIDLGDVYVVGGFQYLPRQDGGINGTVADYAFYVSTDGVTWNAPVAEGTFAADTAKKETGFSGKAGRYVRFVALSDINGGPWTTVAEINVLGAVPVYSTIPWSQLSIVSSDSEELTGENGSAGNAIDGDPLTLWHTEWSQSTPEHPHEIIIDLGDVCVVGGFQYLPRQDGGTNGIVADYAFYVSTDGVTWNAPVAEGTFAADTAKKETGFSGKAGRYVRFVALSDINGGPWTTLAEIDILGVVSHGNQ